MARFPRTPLTRPPVGLGRRGRVVRKGVLLLALAGGGYGIGGFVTGRASWMPDAVQAPLAGPSSAALRGVSSGLGNGIAFRERPRVVRGVLSVHTERSHDAQGSLDEVAEAARRTGLDFVVLGDHPGEWALGGADLGPTRTRDVLLVGGVELVIEDVGRVLVAGLDTVPRVWRGDLASLLERLPPRGGFVSVVHPSSPRARERWRIPGVEAVHAWEVMDMSEIARTRLEGAWAGYHIGSLLGSTLVGRTHESLLRLGREGFDVPALAAYDRVRADGPLALTAGLNHHPKVRLLAGPFPGYDAFFRTFVNQVLIDAPRDDDPEREWELIAESLRRGRSFVSLGDPDRAAGFSFVAATTGGARVEMGGVGPWSSDTVLRIDLPEGGGRRVLVRVVRDGGEVAWLSATGGSSVVWPAPGPGVYRLEVYHTGFRLGPLLWSRRPWILTNPVELRGAVGYRNASRQIPGADR